MKTYRRALVTGASSGIGKAFAERLAGAGSDLVLVARNAERLQELGDELCRHGSGQVEVIAADLEDREQLAAVESRLIEPGDIDLLVNNAGYGYTGAFAEVPLAKSQGQIDCNITALTRLAHAALQAMSENGDGAILNVASGAAFIPTPQMAVYAATKAYVVHFTQALAEEARRDGVTISVVCPGFTRTEFQERAKYDSSSLPDFVWQSADEVAAEALEALAAGKVVCNTGLQNKVAAQVIGLLPRSLVVGLAGRLGNSQK
jgi:short-subunit dehydrogenase